MNVADAMTSRSEVVTVSIPGTREDALEQLQGGTFSSIPVVKETDDGEEFRGLVTREALIERPDEDQLALLVNEVPTVTSDATLVDVARLARETGGSRVPVVDDARLVGIVTVTDIVRALANDELAGADAIVGDLATREVNTTYRGTPLTVGQAELDYAEVPYAVVLDEDGDPEGMLTEVDIIEVARVEEGEENTGESIADEDDDWKWEGIKATGNRYMPTRNVELPAEPVARFMTEDLVTVTRKRTVKDAARLLISNDIEQLPLMTADDLVGIVRDTDLLAAVVADE
ncbi:signal transduction protein [Haloglomus irregulare]|jgi:IMP dehydrogenase|uniref:Signal transduction protein n=1 Tax=Haloglomus irregulare TaxID=2234134 RepID=A0A554NBA0_9EURY|nr:CBS domain-containing protein [Haloglomus irregulare]TSD14662.1 signal transduction protein [Haloglomus irregulare]